MILQGAKRVSKWISIRRSEADSLLLLASDILVRRAQLVGEIVRPRSKPLALTNWKKVDYSRTGHGCEDCRTVFAPP